MFIIKLTGQPTNRAGPPQQQPPPPPAPSPQDVHDGMIEHGLVVANVAVAVAPALKTGTTQEKPEPPGSQPAVGVLYVTKNEKGSYFRRAGQPLTRARWLTGPIIGVWSLGGCLTYRNIER